MSDKRSQSYPARPLSGKLPVLLVVGIFLLCHGMLLCHVVSGAMHLYPNPPLSSATHDAEAIVIPAMVQGAAQEQSINNMMKGSYFAVLILVAFLGLLLKNTRSSWRLWGSATVAQAFGSRIRPYIFHHARGSPASFLQVFRL